MGLTGCLFVCGCIGSFRAAMRVVWVGVWFRLFGN